MSVVSEIHIKMPVKKRETTTNFKLYYFSRSFEKYDFHSFLFFGGEELCPSWKRKISFSLKYYLGYCDIFFHVCCLML